MSGDGDGKEGKDEKALSILSEQWRKRICDDSHHHISSSPPPFTQCDNEQEKCAEG